jgi:hypothetical protein
VTQDPFVPFGSDRAEPASDGAVVLTSSRSKGWVARRPGAQTSAPHPGTAVRWGDRVFEVVFAEPLADGGTRYRLSPWEERHAIRVMDSYDAKREEARSREHASQSRGVHLRRLSILFSPFLGHLPREVQHRMEVEFGAPAAAMTIVSAVPFFILGAIGVLSALAGIFGASPLFPNLPPLVICAYFVAESGLRVASAAIHGEPMGSAVGALGYRLIRAIAPGAVPAAGPKPPSASAIPAPQSLAPESAAPGEDSAYDRFRIIEPLLSLLPRAEQQLLRQRFDFDFLRWGRLSAAILFFAGILNVTASAISFAAGVGGAADATWLAAGLALGVEQVLRWKSNDLGLPRGSVLGILVRPLARPLLGPE